MALETLTAGSYTANIDIDEYAESPREWGNTSTMYCQHRRYSLGDKHDLDFSECSLGNDCIMLPLYLYDHSGITMNTTGYSCSWDSGRVGTIAVSRKDIRKEYGVKRVSPKLVKLIEGVLVDEVKLYDDYLRGEVFELSIEDEEGNVVDSCGGFYGYDCVLSEAKDMLNYYVKKEQKAKLQKLKAYIKNNVPLEKRVA